MICDFTAGDLDIALKHNELDQLPFPNGRVNLFSDFAPLSFTFSVLDKQNRLIYNGGLIYHGSHDNGGDGSSPTFSVSLTPVNGWAIHT